MNDVTLREAPLRFTSNLGEGDEARKADTLNLLPYAEALRDFIHECESPMTIGIQGDWGIGRTSLMNMLRGSGDGQQSGLLDAGLCRTISLDSWPYSQFDQSDYMAAACLYALTQQLGQTLEQEAGVDSAELKLCLEAASNRLVNVMQEVRELGQGKIDFPGVINLLNEINYSGWINAEQDHTSLTPRESAAKSMDYINSELKPIYN